MLPKDVMNNEFNYLDYVVYTDSVGKLNLGKIVRIVISKNIRLVCAIDGRYGEYIKIALKNFKNIEIIPEERAKSMFPDEYRIISRARY